MPPCNKNPQNDEELNGPREIAIIVRTIYSCRAQTSSSGNQRDPARRAYHQYYYYSLSLHVYIFDELVTNFLYAI